MARGGTKLTTGQDLDAVALCWQHAPLGYFRSTVNRLL